MFIAVIVSRMTLLQTLVASGAGGARQKFTEKLNLSIIKRFHCGSRVSDGDREWQDWRGRVGSLGVSKHHDSLKLDLGLLCTVCWWFLLKG